MLTPLRSRLGLSARSFRVVAAYYLSYIALGTVSPTLGPVLPFLTERTGVSLDVASGLFSAKALGFMLGAFVAGRALERLPAHGVMQAALLIMALSMLALALTPTFGLLLLILCVSGFFTAWLDVGSNILIGWQLKEKVAPFLTGLHFIWGVGALLTPLVIVQLQLHTGTLLAPLAVIAVFVSAHALLYVHLPSPAPRQTATVQAAPLSLRPLLVFMTMLFLAGTMEMAIGGFIFTYLLRMDLSTAQVAGGVTSTFYTAITCTRLVTAFLLLRFSGQTVLMVALGLVIGTAATVLLLPPALPVIWIAVLVCGMGEATLFPLALSLAPQYLSAAGRATSLMFVGASIGALTMPLVIGRLFETAPVGPQVVWYYTLAGATLYAGCLLILRVTPRVMGFAVPAPQGASSH